MDKKPNTKPIAQKPKGPVKKKRVKRGLKINGLDFLHNETVASTSIEGNLASFKLKHLINLND